MLDLVPFPHLMAGISFPLAVVVASANFVDSFYVLLALDPEFHNVTFSTADWLKLENSRRELMTLPKELT